jgi:hypothetical protein
MKGKRLFSSILAIGFVAVFALSACGEAQIGHNHKLVRFDFCSAKTSSVCEEYWYCQTCDKLYTDPEGLIAANRNLIETIGHEYNPDFFKNDTHHWKACIHCGAGQERTAHVGGEATCRSKAKCAVCAVEYGKKNAENHKGVTQIRGYVPATSLKEGYTGDTYCFGCGDLIKKGVPIPRVGASDIHNHKLVQKSGKAATCGEPGWEPYELCSECGYTTYVEIPASGLHRYSTGGLACETCGQKADLSRYLGKSAMAYGNPLVGDYFDSGVNVTGFMSVDWKCTIQSFDGDKPVFELSYTIHRTGGTHSFVWTPESYGNAQNVFVFKDYGVEMQSDHYSYTFILNEPSMELYANSLDLTFWGTVTECDPEGGKQFFREAQLQFQFV